MTKEETIKNIEFIRNNLDKNSETRISLDTAIVALKAQPCEDAVSREDALTALTGDITGYIIEEYIARTRIRLQNLPSVTPKQRTGKWLYEKRERLVNETDEGAVYVTDYWCKCSKCGGDFGYRKMKDAFCKYCGAKMEGESE